RSGPHPLPWMSSYQWPTEVDGGLVRRGEARGTEPASLLTRGRRRTVGRGSQGVGRSSGASRAEPRAVLAWRCSRVTSEKLAKERHVLVADLVADFLNRAVRALQIVSRGVDPQAVQICERGLARRRLETTCEVSRAHSDACCQLVEIHGFAEMGVKPL